jgi:hypothetical protein
VEQVIAESSGKDGKGILPVALEPLGNQKSTVMTGCSCISRSNGELEAGIAKLKDAGFPVIEFPIESL